MLLSIHPLECNFFTTYAPPSLMDASKRRFSFPEDNAPRANAYFLTSDGLPARAFGGADMGDVV